ncbi:MAG: GumC family protein, partial [Planctomycetota bacterium]
MAQQIQNRVAMAGPARPLAGAGVEMTPRDILMIMRRHIFLIIFFVFLGIMAGGVSWYLLKRYNPKYVAKTFIEVLSPVDKDPLKIAGTRLSKDIQYGYRTTIASLILQQNTFQDLIERDEIQATQWFKKFGESKSKSISKAMKDLKKNFSAGALRDSDFVSLSMRCGIAKESALIVNEMLSMFVNSYGTLERREVADRLAKFRDQQTSLEDDLEDAERALDQVRLSSGFSDLDVRSFEDTITRKLNDLEIEQNNLLLEIQEVQAITKNYERQATSPINEQVKDIIERDPIMINLGQQIRNQEVSLAGRLTKFGENHREIIQIQEFIKKTKKEREQRKAELGEQTTQANFQNAQDQLIVLAGRLEVLNEMREAADKQKKALDLGRIQYEKRKTIRDDIQKQLEGVKASIVTQKIIYEDPETPKIKSVGLAPVPLEISSPKWQIYFPAGTFLGIALGAGLAFLIELLNDLIRMPRDVSKYLRIPLLGIIPDIEEDEQAEGVNLYHVVRKAPYSILSESYRRFKTNLKLSNPSISSQALLISSGMAGEGKTSVAVNLATTVAADGKRVLLIDANFWRPNLHKVFSKEEQQQKKKSKKGKSKPEEGLSEFGLSTLLSGLCGYQEAVKPTGIENFDIIESGLLPSNPAELLAGTQMGKLIKHQHENYDYIIIDGPPVLLVSDV